MISERAEELYLPISKWAHLSAPDRNRPNSLTGAN